MSRVRPTIGRRKVPSPAQRRKNVLIPRWVPIASIISLAVLLCLTINYRALSDLGRESTENEKLNEQIREAMIDNIGLQEQIHYLKNDSATVEKEVRKFGLTRSEEKISKPAK